MPIDIPHEQPPLFVLSYVAFEVTLRGIAAEYIWAWHTWIDMVVEAVAGSLAITMGLLFARQFLQTKAWAPVMHRLMGVAILAGAAITLGLIIPGVGFSDPAFQASVTMAPLWTLMVQITNTYLLLTVVILVLNAFLALQRGFRAARFYLVAWLLLLAGGIAFSLFNFGLLPSTSFTRNSLSVAHHSK